MKYSVVSLLVCLPALLKKLHSQFSPVAVARSIFNGVVMLCTSGFVDDVMYSHNGSMVHHVSEGKAISSDRI